jgi:hypothetical protein
VGSGNERDRKPPRGVGIDLHVRVRPQGTGSGVQDDPQYFANHALAGRRQDFPWDTRPPTVGNHDKHVAGRSVVIGLRIAPDFQPYGCRMRDPIL